MRNILLFFLLLTFNFSLSQVGIGTTNPEATLDISSSNGGLLIPRVSLTNLSTSAPVVNPQGGAIAQSTLIYHDGTNAITAGFYYWSGSVWIPLGGDNDWIVSGNDLYNANSGNVGIGNMAPSAKLHITGTTTIGGAGGVVTLLNEDFSSYTLNQNHVSDPDCTTTDGWEVSSTGDVNVNCTNCTGNYLYITSDDSGCIQDATAIVNLSTAPTTTSITIDFDYRYNNFSATGDSFRVYLYNNTTGSQTGGDLINTSTDANTSFSGSATTIAGNNYSLRFEYNGNFDYGVTVDNIIITETTTGGAGNYMFRLEDGQQQDGYVLTSDANGNATWEAASAGGTDDQVIDNFSLSGTLLSISIEDDGLAPLTVDLSGLGGGGSYTFESGITETSGTVRLGGALTQDTTIDIGDNDFTINGNSTTGFTGEMTLNGNNRIIFETEVDEDYINFGSSAFVDADDGQTFSDTFGSNYTKDFVWGAHNGSSGGTGIALGSIEYVVDGTDELFYEGSAFSPMSDLAADLGADPFSGTPRRWDDVYADDFTNVTPFAPDDTNPTESGLVKNKEDYKLTKGLEAIMQLKPISYLGGVSMVNGRKLNREERDVKLGFFTSDLLNVIPEAVKTKDWVSLDESGQKTLVYKKQPTGVMYNQIIPVTVKAIQEQQEQIETLKSDIKELKKQNEILMKLLEQK